MEMFTRCEVKLWCWKGHGVENRSQLKTFCNTWIGAIPRAWWDGSMAEDDWEG
jgi:hypothetical protein